MFVSIDRNSGVPVKKQLYDALTRKILMGELCGGDKLPSTRELASDLGIARNTVIEIYEQLAAEAYIRTLDGKGTFVKEDLGEKTEKVSVPKKTSEPRVLNAGRISFGTGVPDLSTFPRKAWLDAMKDCLYYAKDVELGYPRLFGYRPLLESISQYLLKYKGISCSSRQVLITQGTSDAIAFLALLFQKEVKEVLLESAVVSFVPDIFSQYGYGLKPLPVDEQGLCTVDLPEARDCLVFTSPSHQFPLGGTLPVNRRNQLISCVKESGHYVIEDDYDSEFKYQGAPVNSLFQLAPDHVIHLGTFSKTLAPFLRLGYMVLPMKLLPSAKKLQKALNRRVNTLDQIALNTLFQQGTYVKHIHQVTKEYKKKVQTLTKSLRDQFGDGITINGLHSGLHLSVSFHHVKFNQDNRRMFSQHDLEVELLNDYRLEKQRDCDTLIMGFGHLTENEIKEGVSRLKSAIDELMKAQQEEPV